MGVNKNELHVVTRTNEALRLGSGLGLLASGRKHGSRKCSPKIIQHIKKELRASFHRFCTNCNVNIDH